MVKAILLSLNPFRCMLSSCLVTPWVVALMKRLHVSLGLMGTLKGSDAEGKKIICLDDGWNLTKGSFFFVSFSQWKIRVSLAFVFIWSRVSTWCKIETWKRLRPFGAALAGLFPASWAATAAGKAGGAPAGRGGAPKWTLRGRICWEWHRLE